jgi:hypothetical protein
MADLLLHSMAEFADIIFPCLMAAKARKVVEIGSENGTMTTKLITYAAECEGELICVDPSPSKEAEQIFDQHRNARLIKNYSLNVLPHNPADAYLIDGDHNYYTVYHELQNCWENSIQAGKYLLVFLHDVGWPWGRRDLYYNPDMIPGPFRNTHTWEKGVTLHCPDAIIGGFRGEGHWACAVKEGGPRNGVMTAVEDFVKDKPGRFLWAYLPVIFGLGVLFDSGAPWRDKLSEILGPYHNNDLLARMEENRLACYLKVIEWQDRQNEQSD